MTFSSVSWTAREAVTSTKLNQMGLNEDDLNTRLLAAPRGVLAMAQPIKTIQSTTSIWWDVPGLTCGASYEANRTIKVTASWQGLLPWGMPGIWAVQIQNNLGANGAYQIIAQAMVDCTTDHLIVGGGSIMAYGTSSAAGNATWKVAIQKQDTTAGGTMFWYASSAGPSYLMVEDIGASQ